VEEGRQEGGRPGWRKHRGGGLLPCFLPLSAPGELRYPSEMEIGIHHVILNIRKGRSREESRSGLADETGRKEDDHVLTATRSDDLFSALDWLGQGMDEMGWQVLKARWWTDGLGAWKEGGVEVGGTRLFQIASERDWRNIFSRLSFL
jgi:hypothetical protein